MGGETRLRRSGAAWQQRALCRAWHRRLLHGAAPLPAMFVTSSTPKGTPRFAPRSVPLRLVFHLATSPLKRWMQSLAHLPARSALCCTPSPPSAGPTAPARSSPPLCRSSSGPGEPVSLPVHGTAARPRCSTSSPDRACLPRRVAKHGAGGGGRASSSLVSVGCCRPSWRPTFRHLPRRRAACRPLVRAVERVRNAATSVQPRRWHSGEAHPERTLASAGLQATMLHTLLPLPVDCLTNVPRYLLPSPALPPAPGAAFRPLAATDAEVDRMGGQCAICWGDMPAGAAGGAAASAPPAAGTEQQPPGRAPAGSTVPGEAAGAAAGVGPGGAAMALPCGHAFHKDCLQQWLQQCYG